MTQDYSRTLASLPPYPFAEMERIIRERKERKEEVYPFNIGDPDLPTPDFIVEAASKALSDPEYSGYSSSEGEVWFREAVADWYSKRFGVQLDPQTEVCALIGSKEGLVNITRVFANPGDGILYPDPGYPAYSNGGALLAGFKPQPYSLEEVTYQPKVDGLVTKGVKIIFINYPHNPTGAVVQENILRRIIEICREQNILVCYDNAYSEITFNGYRAPSILQFSKDFDGLVEFHSCSKTFSMTGYRIGFAVGDRKAIRGLAKLKAQIDSGPPKFVQLAAKVALESYSGVDKPRFVRDMVETYQKRLRTLVRVLHDLGTSVELPQATFYLWHRVPNSSEIVARNLAKFGILVTPGSAFGRMGEKYIRWSVTVKTDLIERASKYLLDGGFIIA
ncbi:MAG: aminotransferase class I/II-fold pyridoxal phosphate-dependent enzyme [Conexivisphaerales archaeon]